MKRRFWRIQGNGGDGQRLTVASDADVNFGTDKVEACVPCMAGLAAAQKEEEGQQQQSSALIHTVSLDARSWTR